MGRTDHIIHLPPREASFIYYAILHQEPVRTETLLKKG